MHLILSGSLPQRVFVSLPSPPPSLSLVLLKHLLIGDYMALRVTSDFSVLLQRLYLAKATVFMMWLYVNKIKLNLWTQVFYRLPDNMFSPRTGLHLYQLTLEKLCSVNKACAASLWTIIFYSIQFIFKEYSVALRQDTVRLQLAQRRTKAQCVWGFDHHNLSPSQFILVLQLLIQLCANVKNC